ncbi:hypothetical protein Nepgr_020248 [Nepenthes gracilis]|uniref:Uncharacterized protein n=1 Tax=Nepenthes gracilis TaxID=150966 RepID=A0AAD3SXS5_NEPGR|nr:hypothetical protein Nepgr_020248 [Nepenthes gracilis]
MASRRKDPEYLDGGRARKLSRPGNPRPSAKERGSQAMAPVTIHENPAKWGRPVPRRPRSSFLRGITRMHRRRPLSNGAHHPSAGRTCGSSRCRPKDPRTHDAILVRPEGTAAHGPL